MMATPAAVGERSRAADGHGNLRALALAALGVVYGDIGTSPLYTMRKAFGHAGGLHLSEAAVLGVLSLVFWSLILVVTVKYVALILRADNHGEGGVLALGALAARAVPAIPSLCRLIPVLTIAGLALFYGDALITPAISVLSAVEGLETAAPALEPYVVPIAVLVLLALFLIQSRGTARVGALFGPVMLIWFTILGLVGLIQIVRNPAVLAALNPLFALGLFGEAGWQAFVALGAIVLAVTGAEALSRGLELCRNRGLQADQAPRVSYFIGRETLIPTPRPPMGPVEARVFMFLSAGSQSATAHFRIPPELVVELGTQLEV